MGRKEYMQEIIKVDVELARLEDRMENYIPEPDNPEVIKIFCDLVDHEKNGFEIYGVKLLPSDILQKCAPESFEEKLIDFRRIMEEDTLMQISEYREIVSQYKKLKEKSETLKKNYSQKQIDRYKAFSAEDYKRIAIEKVNDVMEKENVICIQNDEFGYIMVDFKDLSFYYFISPRKIIDVNLMADLCGEYLDKEKKFFCDYFELCNDKGFFKAEGYGIKFKMSDEPNSPLDSNFKWPIEEFEKKMGLS